MIFLQPVVCLSLAVFLAGCVSSHVVNTRTQEFQNEGVTITFTNKDGGEIIKEKVTLADNEARFDHMGKTAYVLDYMQNLLFMKEFSEDNKPCYVTMLNMEEAGVPSPREIREKIHSQREFEMPWAKHKLRLQKSTYQEVPDKLPLAEALCGDLDVIVLETVPAGGSAVSSALAKTTKKPKGEPGVGWGEVIVIIIVIIILF